MKTLIRISAMVIMVVMTLAATAQADAKPAETGKKETIKIQTSAVCGMCKERIEHNMAYEKGVKFVELDEETKIVTIEYNPKKTDADKLRKAISAIGYDADDVPANKEAHDKLPACCQKGNDPH